MFDRKYGFFNCSRKPCASYVQVADNQLVSLLAARNTLHMQVKSAQWKNTSFHHRYYLFICLLAPSIFIFALGGVTVHSSNPLRALVRTLLVLINV